MNQKLIDWYNANIVAGWYASASLIGGWLTAAVVWLPDLINWAIDNVDFFGRFVLPTMDPETKAIVISFYVAFIAPPLRAKLQNWMQRKSLKQAVETGKVSSSTDTSAILIQVPDTAPVMVRSSDTKNDPAGA